MKNKPIRIGITGATGRMGQAVFNTALLDADIQVVSLFDQSTAIPDTTHSLPVGDITHLETADVQVLIDFTVPKASMGYLNICCRRGIGMVIGTTGFSREESDRLAQAGKQIPLLVAQNMSVGVNAMYDLTAVAARYLKAGRLGGGYDIEIFEAHHRYKKDAPSGTALRLGRRLAAETGGDFEADSVFDRHGTNNSQRDAASIGFSVARGGDMVGEHRVTFSGTGEQIEIIHRSSSRSNYAAGALRAAKFIATRESPSYYDGMATVLEAVVGRQTDN